MHHRASCKPTDHKPEFEVGDRVCKLAEVNQKPVQVWCVVAVGRGSTCFTYAPNSGKNDESDACTVVAPFSDIEKGYVESREHWIVKYDRSLLTKAPSYHCGHTVQISVNGSLENHVIQECDWTYHDLYTGWIYRVENSARGWMTERFLDGAVKRALQPNHAIKTERTDPDLVTEATDHPSKSKTPRKQDQLPYQDESMENALIERTNNLRKRLREQQSARLKEQMANYNLKTKVKALKQELNTVKTEAKEAMEEAQAEAKESRREVKRKYRALLKKARRAKRGQSSD